MAKAKSLTLTQGDHDRLETITRARTLQAQVVTRARILLLKEAGESVDAIAEKVDLNRNSVLLCLKKYKEGVNDHAIYDAPGRGRNAEITDEEKTWIINGGFIPDQWEWLQQDLALVKDKESKMIILAHSKIYEEKEAAVKDATEKAADKAAKQAKRAVKQINDTIEHSTLGDLEVLAGLKENLEKQEKAAKDEPKAE